MRSMTVLIIVLMMIGCTAQDKSTAHVTEDTAIVGGVDVKTTDNAALFTVGLYDKKTHFICTGVLLRANLVLTAAHCIESSASNIVIVFGLDFSSFDSNNSAFLRTATAVKVHPDFNKDGSDQLDMNDLALVQFSDGIPDGFAPISLLKDASLLKKGTTVHMAGYGSTGVELEEVSVKNDKKFKQALASGEIVCYDKELSQCYRVTFLGTDRLRITQAEIEGFTEKEIRLNESKGHGTCVGDSGGPLLLEQQGIFQLVGVTSRGSAFCDGPAVYTNTTEYIDWIEQNALILAQ